jgi:hypothetical protein
VTPDYCTCGAQLVPDALFCHKCGKPLRDLVEETQPIPPHAEFAPPPVPPAPQPQPLNFHNPVAVKVAFLVALIATLLSWVPLLNILLWGAAGFCAVVLYRRRTGALVNVRGGVSLGWITGVIMFVLTTIIFTVTVLPMAASGGIASLFRSQFKNTSDPNVQEALRMLDTSSGLAAILLATLFMLFVFITLLSMAGGALGAMMGNREKSL